MSPLRKTTFGSRKGAIGRMSRPITRPLFSHEDRFYLKPPARSGTQIEHPVAGLYQPVFLLYLFQLVGTSRPVSFLFRLLVKSIFDDVARHGFLLVREPLSPG